MNAEPAGNKTYLGDSVYAEHDGFHLILTTENGLGVSNTIFLEPIVLKNLDLYLKRMQEMSRPSTTLD